jgi:hypothetical protein
MSQAEHFGFRLFIFKLLIHLRSFSGLGLSLLGGLNGLFGGCSFTRKVSKLRADRIADTMSIYLPSE